MRFQYKLLAVSILVAGATTAQAQIYKATLSGANEVPAVTTAGTGVGVVSFNTTTHEMRVRTTFSGLNGTVTASHIHCCTTGPGTNAGVATTTPTFAGFPSGVREGTYNTIFNMTQAASWNAAFITANGGTPATAEAALVTGLVNNRTYLNIHSSTSAGGEIRANLVRFSFVPASNASTASLAAALDSVGAGTGSVNEQLVGLAFLDAGPQSAALQTLLPIPTSVVAATFTNTLYADYDQISNRLAGLRGDGTAANGFWVRGAYRQNEQDLASRSADVESNGFDAGAGIDHRLPSGLLLGASLSVSQDSLDYGGTMLDSTGDLESWRATAYAEHTFGAGFIEGMVTMAQNDSESGRRIAGNNSLAIGGGENEQWGFRAAVGTDWALGTGLTATPQLRVDWSSLELDGYREIGANGLGLAIASQDIDSTRISVGGQIDWETAANVTPFVRGFWGNELEDDDIVTTGTFVAGGSAFTASDAGPDSSGLTLGVGVNFAGSDTFGASVSYDRTDNDDFESDLFQARALFRF